MGAIERCIYPVPATKTKPAGFRVQKFVRDQKGVERKRSKTFRPHNDSEEARKAALEKAREFRDKLELRKEVHVGSGKAYVEFAYDKGEKREPTTAPIGVFLERLQELVDNRAHGDKNYFKFLLKQAHGTDEERLEDRKVTLREYVEEDYLPWIERRNSKSDHQQKKAVWSLIQSFGKQSSNRLPELTIHDIEPKHVDGFAEYLERQTKKKDEEVVPKYSKSTVVRYFKVLKSIVRGFAKKMGADDPADPAKLRLSPKRIKGRSKTQKVPGLRELAKLEEGFRKRIQKASDGRFKQHLPRRKASYFMHRVLKYTGLRPSELFYFRLEHYDRENRVLRVEGAAVDGEGGYTKTGKAHSDAYAGRKMIPVLQPARDAIDEWLEIRTDHGFPDIGDCDILFPDEEGGYFTDDSLRTHYKGASKEAGLKRDITPYMMRHGFNDRLRQLGVPSELRQALMGHLSEDVNLNYTDVDPRELHDLLAGEGDLYSEE
jgi:integrase